MKNLFSYIAACIKAISIYFLSMNSETGKVSMKRNVSLILTFLLCWVVYFTVTLLCKKMDCEKLIPYLQFILVVIASMILLVLGITSIEKISDLIQRIKGGVALPQTPSNDPAAGPVAMPVAPAPAEPAPQQIIVNTEVTTNPPA